MTNPQVRKRYVDPIVYEVGKDITREKYEEALLKIADWFVEWRNSDEPALLAKQLFQECMDGKTTAGQPWFSAANSTLAARVRSKCRFDIETMTPCRSASPKEKKKKAKERKQEVLRKLKEKPDLMIPDEIRKELRQDLRYGDDPSLWMTSAEQREWDILYEDYKTQHPELSAVSSKAELKMLCDTHVLMERFRALQMAGKKVDQQELEATVKRFSALKKSLGIHPDQIKTKTKGIFDASIGEAVARFKELGEDEYRNLRERMWIEELIQLYQMYHTPNANGTGYQLDEIGLYGLTRSKPEPCPKCNTMVYSGLTIEDIEKYLLRKKAIEQVEVVDEQEQAGDSSGTDGERPDQPASGAED